MRLTLLAYAVALFSAAPAFAAEARLGGGGMSLFFSLLQMSLALLVVVGLILVTYYGATRLMKSIPVLNQAGRHIRLIESRPLGPRKSLLLVEVGGEYLLLANCDNSISLLKQIDMLEEIETVGGGEEKRSFLSFLRRSGQEAGAEDGAR